MGAHIEAKDNRANAKDLVEWLEHPDSPPKPRDFFMLLRYHSLTINMGFRNRRNRDGLTYTRRQAKCPLLLRQRMV
jgi:hypothetical protein